jgi:hypothetical protein
MQHDGETCSRKWAGFVTQVDYRKDVAAAIGALTIGFNPIFTRAPPTGTVEVFLDRR